MKIIMTILLLCTAALSCDPNRLSFAEAKDSFDLIFTGRVIATKQRIDEVGPSLISTFQIETVWKGNQSLKEIDIETTLWGCSQTRFTVTERHLIFANKRGNTWSTTGHDQHNEELYRYEVTEKLELMALSDWYKGTSYYTSKEFTPTEVEHLVDGLITKEDLKEESRWKKSLPCDSVETLVKERRENYRESLNYPGSGETLFILNDTLMTRRDYFLNRTGNSRFRLYKIPEDFVKEMELRTNRVIVAHSSYNFYSSPKPVPLLSQEELKLLLLDRISEFHDKKKK